MKKFISLFSGGLFLLFFSVQPAWAGHPDKDIGEDPPDAILWGDATAGSVGGAMQGDIDGNGLPDLIVSGAMKIAPFDQYVGVFFDVHAVGHHSHHIVVQILLLRRWPHRSRLYQPGVPGLNGQQQCNRQTYYDR